MSTRQLPDMVSRENEIVAACIVAAVALLYPVSLLDPPTWVGLLVIFGVGVVLPGVLTGRFRT